MENIRINPYLNICLGIPILGNFVWSIIIDLQMNTEKVKLLLHTEDVYVEEFLPSIPFFIQKTNNISSVVFNYLCSMINI